MKKYDIFLIGHISVDEVQELDGTHYGFYGGAEFFSSYAAAALGHNVGILTKMKADQKMLMDVLEIPNDDIYFLASEENTSMVNQFLSADRERRRLHVKSVADQFKISEVPEIDSEIYHLAGLIYGDFEDGMIEDLSKKGKVAVDMQGYLRCLDKESRELYFEDYAFKKRDFPFIHFLKTDAAEAEILTGTDNREEAAKMMHSWGAKEVMITHNTEVMVYDGNKIYTCPIKSRNFSGRTGRGDTTFASYITERLTKNVEDALLFATAMVSYKMEQPGPFKKRRSDVEDYINAFYR